MEEIHKKVKDFTTLLEVSLLNQKVLTDKSEPITRNESVAMSLAELSTSANKSDSVGSEVNWDDFTLKDTTMDTLTDHCEHMILFTWTKLRKDK